MLNPASLIGTSRSRPRRTGRGAFKFRHILIRDAAYAALPKRERADLHERFATWLEHAAGDRTAEFGDIIGHHLEQAHHYRVELGSARHGLAARAADWLTAAAWRAWERSDWSAAAATFERAAALTSDVDNRLDLLEHAAWALRSGGEYLDVIRAAAALATEADRNGSEGRTLRAALLAAETETVIDQANNVRLVELVRTTKLRAAELDDSQTLLTTLYVEAVLEETALRYDAAHTAYQRVMTEAQQSGWRPLVRAAGAQLLVCAQFGSASVAQVRSEAELLRETGVGGMDLEVWGAGCEILVVGYAQAKAVVDRASDFLTEIGQSGWTGASRSFWATYAVLTGDAGPAAELALGASNDLRHIGNEATLRTAQAVAAEALALLGRIEEADRHLAEAALADPSDVITHVIVHRAASRIALARGRIAEGQRQAERASELLAGVQAPLDLSETLVVWSEVHRANGATDEGRRVLAEARALMERKGATAAARRIDSLIAQL